MSQLIPVAVNLSTNPTTGIHSAQLHVDGAQLFVLTPNSDLHPYSIPNLVVTGQQLALANVTEQQIVAAVASSFFHIINLTIVSSVAGDIQFREGGVNFHRTRVQANVAYSVPFGLLGYATQVLNTNIGVFNNTGGAIDLTYSINYIRMQ